VSLAGPLSGSVTAEGWNVGGLTERRGTDVEKGGGARWGGGAAVGVRRPAWVIKARFAGMVRARLVERVRRWLGDVLVYTAGRPRWTCPGRDCVLPNVCLTFAQSAHGACDSFVGGGGRPADPWVG